MFFTNQFYPKIMGVLNLTPDSFYNKSRFSNGNYQNRLNEFAKADIIDIGCESSRPGAKPVSEEKEMDRLVNFLEHFDCLNQTLSIDTYKPNIARFALENGFEMINDITGGGENFEMLEIVAEFNCPIIIMHMKGNPENMQNNPNYHNVMDEIISFFELRLEHANNIGLNIRNIILDPGIGFGKRIEDNDTILTNIAELKKLGCQILIGLSRKSFLNVDGDNPEDRLPATLGATTIAIENGADILRVHDVKATYKMIKIVSRILKTRQMKKDYSYN